MYVASENGHLKIVQYFHSLDKNLYLQQNEDDGKTPMYVASENGHLEIVRYLLTIADNIDDLVFQNDGNTALHAACIGGNRDIVTFILPHVDLNAKDADGNTPLHFACENGHFELVRYLLTLKNIQYLQNNSGMTVVHSCCTEDGNLDNLDIIKLLHKKGVPLNTQNNYGETVMHNACWLNQIEVVQFIYSKNAGLIYPQNDQGNTPLHIACRTNSSIVVKFLIRVGANLTIANNDGNNPIRMACLNGSMECLRILVWNGVAVPAAQFHYSTSINLFLEEVNNAGGSVEWAKKQHLSRRWHIVRMQCLYAPDQWAPNIATRLNWQSRAIPVCVENVKWKKLILLLLGPTLANETKQKIIKYL